MARSFEGDGAHRVADVHHQAHVMLHQQNGAPVFLLDAADQLGQLRGLRVVQPAAGSSRMISWGSHIKVRAISIFFSTP